jgi:proteasome lid subunit RPN8/RPN11
MKWKNLESDIKAIHIENVNPELTAIDIVNLISYTNQSPLIIFPDLVRIKILQHLNTKNVELGGLLVGNVISMGDLDTGILCIVVKDSTSSQDFSSTSVSLSMNPSVWQQANRNCDNETFIVGWYHSHPNLGAFFSSVDRKTQKDFFNSVYNLGLVIDPIRNEEKWFIGPDSTLVNSESVKNQFYGLALE